MFALKTDKPQRRHARRILWPMVFVLIKSKTDKILKFQGLYPAKTTRKKRGRLWYGTEKAGDISSRPGSVTSLLGAQSPALHFLSCKTQGLD